VEIDIKVVTKDLDTIKKEEETNVIIVKKKDIELKTVPFPIKEEKDKEETLKDSVVEIEVVEEEEEVVSTVVETVT